MKAVPARAQFGKAVPGVHYRLDLKDVPFVVGKVGRVRGRVQLGVYLAAVEGGSGSGQWYTHMTVHVSFPVRTSTSSRLPSPILWPPTTRRWYRS